MTIPVTIGDGLGAGLEEHMVLDGPSTWAAKPARGCRTWRPSGHHRCDTPAMSLDRMPEFIEPMLATLAPAPFDDPAWLFEVKWDGFRVEAVVRDGEVRTWTRGKKDAASYFGAFLAPPTWIDATEAIVDGEVVAFGADGEPDFALLGSGSGRLAYVIFDLLWLDGASLLGRPLEERKATLRQVLRDDPRVRFSDHVDADGLALYAAAERRHLEGIMAKDRRSTYHARWLARGPGSR